MSERLTDEEIEEMRKTVKAARKDTGDRWERFKEFYIQTASKSDKRIVVADAKMHGEIKDYITTFDPSCVKRLLDEVERLRTENERYEDALVEIGCPPATEEITAEDAERIANDALEDA